MSAAKVPHPKLGQLAATAICGNDILSSALYVSGIAILFAGIYAPLVLLFIGGVLWLYKKVYTEVVEALPVNGGAYNCLLNATSKTIAATAGVMTLLSYVATAVISAKVGVEYLNIGVEHAGAATGFVARVPVIPVTIGVLFLFALLVISGVKDSARVAIGIFILHIATLSLFLILGTAYAVMHAGGFVWENVAATQGLLAKNGNLLEMFYLAFSASLLGISGFESSANFVEEQQHGVFRKTLRNMLVGVTIFNPLIALVVLQSMPYAEVVAAKDFLLADAAHAIGGQAFQYLVVIDAFLVLCGAVLTSYVGVSGLLHRMSADACIPGFFGKQNDRGAFPRIVLGFFVLCASILLLTGGNLLSLAGVYTIAFLCVMSMFAFGNLILKEARPDLKRTYRAPFPIVGLALLATTLGVFGNIRIDQQNLVFFEFYFIPTIAIILCVIYADYLLKFLLRITQPLPVVHRQLLRIFARVIQGRFVAFIHHPSRLQPILDYIHRNETGTNVTLVHCRDENGDKSEASLRAIRDAIPHLKAAGFYPHLSIDLIERDIPFGPTAIRRVAHEMDIPLNRIFIGSIHHTHSFDYADLGGVRIIFG